MSNEMTQKTYNFFIIKILLKNEREIKIAIVVISPAKTTGLEPAKTTCYSDDIHIYRWFDKKFKKKLHFYSNF